MSISDNERELREYLGRIVSGGPRIVDTIQAVNLLALLDRPVMPTPEDVPAKVLDDAWMAAVKRGGGFLGMQDAIKVLHDWRTKPAEPVKVEAWAVLWPSGTLENVVVSRESAKRLASSLSQPGRIVHLVEADRD